METKNTELSLVEELDNKLDREEKLEKFKSFLDTTIAKMKKNE